MATLVIGPTCAGKSTFIAQSASDLASSTLLGFEVPERGVPEGTSFVHYNLFHPWESADFTVSIADRLRAEPILSTVLRSGIINRAVVLVASRDDLRRRIMRRDHLEPLLRPDVASGYSPQQWTSVLDGLDLFRLYEELVRLLEEFNIDLNFLYSENLMNDEQEFVEVDRLFVHRILRGEPIVAQPTPKEVARVKALPGAHYQIVELPGGARTDAGGFTHVASGRRQTFDKIFHPSDLRGVSVLDVGCALGDFLFQAELRGAGQLVGLEPHPERFEAACAIGEMRGSSVVFLNELLGESSTASPLSALSNIGFDWVLALNVLHHVSDIHGFVTEVVAFASRHVVFEFPTFEDALWQDDNHKCEAAFVASASPLPLVGVGVRAYDQRFVFNDSAVIALVAAATDRLKPAVWYQSPIQNRRIIIFCSEGGCPDCVDQTRPLDAEVAQPDSADLNEVTRYTKEHSAPFWRFWKDRHR